MAEPIDPINLRLSQLLGEEDLLAQVIPPAPLSASLPAGRVELTGNAFEDILTKAIESLEGISRQETYAQELIDKYLKGEIDLQEVMVSQAKLSILIQLAVTTITTAVNTFKEITQMQV